MAAQEDSQTHQGRRIELAQAGCKVSHHFCAGSGRYLIQNHCLKSVQGKLRDKPKFSGRAAGRMRFPIPVAFLANFVREEDELARGLGPLELSVDRRLELLKMCCAGQKSSSPPSKLGPASAIYLALYLLQGFLP